MIKWIKALPLALLLLTTVVAHAADKPRVIRYGYLGNSYGKPYTNGVGGVMDAQNLLEKEFEKDGIRIEKTYVTSSGPGLNEAFAAGLIDFANFGDFPNIVGKAGGLRTKLILTGANGNNTRIIIHSQANITTVKGLKGLRVGLSKGTWTQLWFAKLLGRNGLTEKDVKLLNLKGADATAAFAAGSVDAVVGGDLALVDQGIAKILYESKKEPLAWRGRNALLVSEEFAKRYPDIVRRVVKANLRAAYWMSQEKNREELLRIEAKTGSVYKNSKEDLANQVLKIKYSPILDKGFIDDYKDKVNFCYENGLIRRKVDVDQWIDRSYYEAALKELGLQNYWSK
jgi:sulfonate transport system substrate-binding protein